VNVVPAPTGFQGDVGTGAPPEHVADAAHLIDRHHRVSTRDQDAHHPTSGSDYLSRLVEHAPHLFHRFT
jgi:hypothetical protein